MGGGKILDRNIQTILTHKQALQASSGGDVASKENRSAVQTALADVFLSAPFGDDGWDTALKELARRSGGGRGQLLAIGGPHSIPFNWVTDVLPGAIEACVAIGGGGPDISWRVAASGAPLEVVSEFHYSDAARSLKTSVYQDFAEWYDIPLGCQTTLYRDASVLIGMAVLKSRSDGVSTEDDRDMFGAAAPHALTAVRIQHAIEQQGAKLAAGTLETMDAAVFVCDGRGRVIALTPSAEAAMRDAGPASLRLSNNRLSAYRPDDDRRLQSGLQAMLTPSGAAPAPVQLWLEGESGPPSGRLCEIFPLPRRQWGLGFEARMIVVLRAPASISAARHTMLTRILGLTPAEADVASLIAEGFSRDEIAARRNVSPQTVHTQIKTIFAKADVSREAQLAALINRLLR